MSCYAVNDGWHAATGAPTCHLVHKELLEPWKDDDRVVFNKETVNSR